STMIHGAAMRRASAQRIPIETTTRPATDSPASRRRSVAKPDLAQPGGEYRHVAEADLGRRGRDLSEHGLADDLTARDPSERRGVEIGDPVEAVFASRQLEAGGTHLAA